MKLDHPYPILFLGLSGSHLYGMQGSFSDQDFHGVHCLPLEHVLGFPSGGDTIEIKRPEENLEVVTHDLKKHLLLLIKGNGSALEDLYTPDPLVSGAAHQELKKLAVGCFSKRCADHYRGMAFNQQKRMQLNDVKKLLHCYRCLLMAVHLMRSGSLEYCLPTLAEEYDVPTIQTLLAYRKEGIEGIEKQACWEHERTLEHFYNYLEECKALSSLPDFTAQETKKTLEDFLVRVRTANNKGVQL